MEYPKTENLYASNGLQNADRKTGPEFGFRQPEVGLIGKWLVLDKLDGMNMRVIWDDFYDEDNYDNPLGKRIWIHGRTDKAQIPGDLMDSIRGWATEEALYECFGGYIENPGDPASRCLVDCPETVILFGEGIGPGIQGAAGQAYGGEKRFVLFDVLVDGHWLKWDDVVGIAGKLGIEHAQVLARDVDLDRAKTAAVNTSGDNLEEDGGPRPFVEGGILRTDPYVFDWRGNRVMAKYKVRDL